VDYVVEAVLNVFQSREAARGFRIVEERPSCATSARAAPPSTTMAEAHG